MTSRRKLNIDRYVARDWLKQLQNRGASRSRFALITEADAQKRLMENPQILEKIWEALSVKKIDAQKEIQRFFPSSGKLAFQSHVEKISTRLNSILEREDGHPFIPPIVSILPGPSLSPVHQRVLSTDTEIILIPMELMMLSNLVARSIAMVINPRASKDKKIHIQLPSAIDLNDSKHAHGLNYLSMIILFHIAHRESFFVPLPPIGKRHEPLRSWILDAIETFAIAHEYGHFVAGHSDEPADAESRVEGIPPHIAMELEADFIGQTLSVAVGQKTKNPLLITNIGAILLLHIGEYIRQARSILNEGKSAPASDTHPSLEQRILALQNSSRENFCAKRGGSGNSDSVVSGSLASPKPPGGGEPEEQGDEENTTESRSHV